MQFTKDEIEELAKDTCPHCKAGIAVRQRDYTKEWVHDSIAINGVARPMSGHSICWANGLRKKYG